MPRYVFETLPSMGKPTGGRRFSIVRFPTRSPFMIRSQERGCALVTGPCTGGPPLPTAEARLERSQTGEKSRSADALSLFQAYIVTLARGSIGKGANQPNTIEREDPVKRRTISGRTPDEGNPVSGLRQQSALPPWRWVALGARFSGGHE